MLNEKTHTQTQTHTQAHTQRAWLFNTRGLTRYSSAMCGEYCCIPHTQYAQHITLLISLTLSFSVSSSYALTPFLHQCLPSARPLLLLFLFYFPQSPFPIIPFRLFTVHALSLYPWHLFPLDLSISFFSIYPYKMPLCCYLIAFAFFAFSLSHSWCTLQYSLQYIQSL